MLTIIDYGMGNLRSVQKAFEHQGFPARITSDPADVAKADRLILPGVGAFRDAIKALANGNFIDPIKDHIAADKPFLGICLGLQLLFDVSYEDGEYEGLGVIPGRVIRFEDSPDRKVPHMGWNQLEEQGEPRILQGIPRGSYFYFVHSYYVTPNDDSVVAARTDYGPHFVSMIERGNLFATQFHPEKSQAVGLKLLQNFAELS